jgi:hypothetical protein
VKALYSISAVLRFAGRLPKETRVSHGHVFGRMGAESVDVTRWRMPPHKLLANLPAQDTETGIKTKKPVSGLADAKLMEAFVKRYGVVSGEIREDGTFDEDAVHFTDAQDTLRKAWMGDASAIQEIKQQVKDALEVNPSVRAKGLELTTDNLWNFICVLFLLDEAAGKVGACGNPECASPYFLRKRKDQKYCGCEQCSAYAQQRYALGWWDRKGYELRAKRSKAKPANRRNRT